MSRLAVAFGVAILIMGVTILVAPDLLLSLADRGSRGGLYLKAALGLVSGPVLILAARDSRFPNVLRFLGGLGVLAGSGGDQRFLMIQASEALPSAMVLVQNFFEELVARMRKHHWRSEGVRASGTLLTLSSSNLN